MENLINSDMIVCLIVLLALTLLMTASAKLLRRERPGADAIVSEQPREWSLQAHRAPAHGKERTPC